MMHFADASDIPWFLTMSQNLHDNMFVDALDITIGSALMQLTQPNWYRPVYYSSHKLSTAERTYCTTEWGALGMIYNINKF